MKTHKKNKVSCIMKSLKIPENRRRTENTMTERIRTNNDL